jgi:hypothetical protein
MTAADTKENLWSANQRKSFSAGKIAALQVVMNCMSLSEDSYGIYIVTHPNSVRPPSSGSIVGTYMPMYMASHTTIAVCS